MHANAVVVLALIAAAGQATALPTLARRCDTTEPSTSPSPSVSLVPTPSASAVAAPSATPSSGTDFTSLLTNIINELDGQSTQAVSARAPMTKDQRRQQIIQQLSGKSKPKRDESSAAAPADSEALNLGSIVKVGGDIISGVESLFGGSSDNNNQRREFIELLARQAAEDPNSEALNLGSIVKIGSDIFSGVSSLFGSSNDNNQRREFIELLARQAAEDPNSEALNLGSIVKIGSDIFSGVSSLFSGSNDNNQRRELIELLARQAAGDPNSEALNLGSIVKVGGDIISGLSDIFGGSSSDQNQNQRRELFELIARQAAQDPNSEALNLGSIVKIGGDIINGVEGLFGGSNDNNNQRREFIELLARQAAEDPSSEALNLGSIVKVGGDIISGLSDIFGGSSSDQNQNQRRELLELIARQATQDPSSEALNLGSIFKIGSGIVSGVESLFGGNSNQNSKRFVVLPGQSGVNLPKFNSGAFPNGLHPVALRSINDLD